MKERSLVIITTRLPPQACGIGTYSWLAFARRPENSGRAQFLVMEGAAQSRAFLNWNEVTDFDGDAAMLEQALNRAGPANVLLHYAGRGYQRLGFPLWMPRALSKWKTRFPEGRLTIFFHEVPGGLPLRSRHFLFGKLSLWTSRQLAVLADTVVTNTEGHAAILRRLSDRDDISVLPVGSNIEPLPTASDARVNTEFVVFGLPFGRLQTLKLFDTEIRRWQTSGRMSALHLIGPEDERFANRINQFAVTWPRPEVVVRHGFLSELETARLFARARFALTNVTTGTWSKSGVFMTCAATGCGVVIKQDRTAIVPLVHAISAGELENIPDAELAGRVASLKAWYYKNADWNVTAKQLALLTDAGVVVS